MYVYSNKNKRNKKHMKKLLVIIALCLPALLVAQEFDIVNTTPTNLEFRSIICDSNYIIASCSDGIYRSNDRGVNWEKNSNQIMYAHKFKKVNENVFALTNEGLYRSKNKGIDWEFINNGLPESRIYDLCFFKDNIFVSIGEAIYKSSNFGDNWISAGAIPIGTGYIRVITSTDSLLFFGCEFFRVYYSDDLGINWRKWDIEIEGTIGRPVEDLIIDDSLIFISEMLQNIFISTNHGKTFSRIGPQETIESHKEDSFIIYSTRVSTSIMTYPFHGDYLYTVDFRFKIGFRSFSCDTEYIYGVSGNNLYRLSKCIFQKPSFEIDTNYTNCIGDTVELISNQDCAEKNKWIINDGEKVIYSQDSIYLKVDKQSDYKVTLRKSNKFLKYSDSITFYINVIDNPEKPTISKSNDTLYSSADNGNQWYLEDTLIVGAVGRSHFPLYVGNYSVQVGKDDCLSEMSDKYYVDAVGIEEFITTTTITPNPAKNYIEINNVILSETKDPVLNVKVFDVLGAEVLNTSTSFLRKQESHGSYDEIPNQVGNDIQSFRIDVSSLSPGVYFVSVGGKMYKFVKL